MSAIYPTLHAEPLYAHRANSSNVLTEPQTTTIPATTGFSKVIGFGGMPIIVQIELLTDADSDDDVLIESGGINDANLAKPTTLATQAIDNLVTGNVVTVNLDANVGYWRIKNTSSAAIKVTYFYKPNR